VTAAEVDAMHCEHCGAGDAILFIHGMPTSGRLWRGVTTRLQDRFTCFTIDLPGLGRSQRESYGPDFLGRLAERIDALRVSKGISRWHVVGHDAGSVVAVHYAHAFPERVGEMALLAPALFPDLHPFFLIEPLRKPVIGEVLAPLIRPLFWRVAMQRALEGAEYGDEAVADFYAPFAGRAGAWRFMNVLRWGKPAEVLARVPEFLSHISVPTLIMHGAKDVAIPEAFAHRAAALMPNARLMILDSSHFLPLAQAAAVASALADFFERGVPPAAPLQVGHA